MDLKVLAGVMVASSSAFFTCGFPTTALSAAASAEWKAPAGEAEKKNPVAPSPPTLAAGKGVYSRECVSCHGLGGKGDGKKGRDLQPLPANLSDPKVTAQTDGALFWKISTGRKPMPSFQKELSDDERWQVIDYIRTLAPNGGGDAKP